MYTSACVGLLYVSPALASHMGTGSHELSIASSASSSVSTQSGDDPLMDKLILGRQSASNEGVSQIVNKELVVPSRVVGRTNVDDVRVAANNMHRAQAAEGASTASSNGPLRVGFVSKFFGDQVGGVRQNNV